MELTINGKPENIAEDKITVEKLLKVKNIKMPEMVSVELNDEFVEREKFSLTYLKAKDRVEFLYFMGGGRE